MGCRSTIRKLDMFRYFSLHGAHERKVPTDLTEGSTCGSILTLFTYIAIAVLVSFEFSSYLTVESGPCPIR